MNNQATLEKMKQLRFLGMQQAFRICMESNQSLTADELIAYLIEAEWNERHNRRITTLIRAAHFRYQASIEELDLSLSRNIDKNMLIRLCDCSFIEKKQNLLITGSTGVGKSYIASALGHQACMQGYKVMYFNLGKLFSRLKMSKADASYSKEISRIEKQDLLILDDFGLVPLDSANRLALLEIIEDRHGKHSTIIASQLPVSQWYELMQEQTIADAILDRIVHTAHRIELKGESMRKNRKIIS